MRFKSRIPQKSWAIKKIRNKINKLKVKVDKEKGKITESSSKRKIPYLKREKSKEELSDYLLFLI